MATEITIEVDGFDEFVHRLNQLNQTDFGMIVNSGFRAIGDLFVPHKGIGPLADETPKRTGKLARSTYYDLDPIGDPMNQELDILQPAQTEEGDFYGLYVREGTVPHVILPRRKKALAWGRDLGGGKKEFVRRIVHHPGTQANKYHVRVLDRLMPSVQDIVNRMGAKVTAYLSGKGG